MWNILLGLLGGPLKTISNDIKEAYQSRLNAQNTTERVAADERISKLEANRDVIIANQPNRSFQVVQLGLALPYVLYNAKLIIWDKILEWGVTDPLSPELTYIQMMVLGGFFLDQGIKRYRK